MQKGKKQDLCDGLLSIGTFMFVGTWLLAIISWIFRSDYPATMVQYVTVMHGVCYAAYCCKAAYENKIGKKGGGGE